MNVADEIEKLVKLRDRGVLTEEEFHELKAETLGMEKSRALVETDNNNNNNAIKETTIKSYGDEPLARGKGPKPNPSQSTYLEEFQEPKTEKLALEKSRSLVENDNNSTIKDIKIRQETVVNNKSLEKTSIFKNSWVKALSVLIAVIACVSLGIWIARQNKESVVNTTSENKTESTQKQDVSDAEYAKLEAKLDKLQADFNNKQMSAATENPNTSATPENNGTAIPATAPIKVAEATQAPPVTEKEALPVTEAANPEKTEAVQQSSTKALIQYPSDATPFVLQMLESARDTDKLFAAKSGLDGLVKPARGDRVKARKLNDSAIALIKESKDQEALPLLEEAHDTDPSDIEITNNLASTYSRIPASDNIDLNSKTKAMLVETLLLKSDRAIAWANLGRAFANEGNEKAATNCYINFFRFAENKEKALSRLQGGINESHPVLSKALTNAYSYVKASIEPTNNT